MSSATNFSPPHFDTYSSRADFAMEIADLMYHVLVLMVEMGISTQEIFDELASRHVIDKKVKQEKMT